ncbi:MAG: GGDEF domain-containing protein [Patescibacteria group bacterium]
MDSETSEGAKPVNPAAPAVTEMGVLPHKRFVPKTQDPKATKMELETIIANHPNLSDEARRDARIHLDKLFLGIDWDQMRINNLSKSVNDLKRQLDERDQSVRLLAQRFSEKAREAKEATVDPETGLCLLPQFDQMVLKFLHNEQRHIACAMGCIDLSHFKEFNDTYGHLSGNVVLREVALILNSIYETHTPIAGNLQEKRVSAKRGTYDVAFRLGDEFYFFIASVASKEDCLMLGHRITKRIAEITIDGIGPANVKGDLGIVYFSFSPQEIPGLAEETLSQMKEWSDWLMYEVKEDTHKQRDLGAPTTPEDHCLMEVFSFAQLMEKPPFREKKIR